MVGDELFSSRCFAEIMENFIGRWGFVIFTDDGLVEVMGVQADVEGAVWFLGVCEG